jgi:hypothetical protein
MRLERFLEPAREPSVQIEAYAGAARASESRNG